MRALTCVGLAALLSGCELLTQPGQVIFVDANVVSDGSVEASSVDGSHDVPEAGLDALVDGGVSAVDLVSVDGIDLVDLSTTEAESGADARDVIVPMDDGAVDVPGSDSPDAPPVDVSTDVPTDGPDLGCMETVCGTACVDTSTDPSNCSTCGYSCLTRPNTATATCVGGMCNLMCQSGFGDCDMSRDNGCETDLNTAATHCGSCANVCPSLPNAVPTCVSGGCSFTCNPGFANCDNIASNGCEVDLSTNTNCGACGMHCGGASDTCTALGGGSYACCVSAGVAVGCAVAFCATGLSCRLIGSSPFCCR